MPPVVFIAAIDVVKYVEQFDITLLMLYSTNNTTEYVQCRTYNTGLDIHMNLLSTHWLIFPNSFCVS